MASNTHFAWGAVNAEADALAAYLSNGWLRIYDGTQPTDADARITTQSLLAELRFGSPAFAKADHGELKANRIGPCRQAAATGTATWFRCSKSDGATAVVDGSVGTFGCDLNLDNVAIQTGGEIRLSSFKLKLNRQ